MKLKALLLTTLLSTTLFAGFTTVDCNNPTHLDTLKLQQVECEILDAFWDSMHNGQGWKYDTGWDKLTYADTWSGVELHDDNSSIRSFGWGVWWGVTSNNLTGRLPDELGNFINIKTLVFQYNDNLEDYIPMSINNLSSLEILALSANKFTGSLPRFSNLVNLKLLFMPTNHFTGSIPLEYNKLIQLEHLSLYDNNLSGPLPDLSRLTQLSDFRIYKNHFSFADIEPQLSWLNPIESVSYAVQKSILNTHNETIYFDHTLVIVPKLATNPSGNDQYIWYPTNPETNRIYKKENAGEEDSGCHHYKVTNPNVTRPDLPKSRNLIIYSQPCIMAEHDNTPTVTNQTPSEVVTEGETYTYTSTISDSDSNDTLSVTSAALPTWLTLSSHTDAFILEGTPTLSDLGSYDINITVTDGKIPVHINYKLRVDPESGTLPAGFTFSNGTYTHTITNNTLSGEGALTIVNAGLELTETCVNNKMAFVSLDSNGRFLTGYKECTSNDLAETFSTTLPNNTKASIVTNNNEKMILIEIPLTQDITLQGE